jgi:hypothetical protein
MPRQRSKRARPTTARRRRIESLNRDLAFENILLAAQYYGVSLAVGRWEELGPASAAASSDHSSAEG